MTTPYPFDLPHALVGQLPPSTRDGLRYIDVRVRGSWDGVLVLDPSDRCVGIQVRGRVEQCPLPFEAASIEAVRPASLWNRVLARVPFDLHAASLVAVFIASPATLALSAVWSRALAPASIVSCLLAIRFLYLGSGFPLVRPFAALLALAQVVLGVAVLSR